MSAETAQEFEWVVVHGGDGSDGAKIEPRSAEECYADRDPYGEYVFYAAGDPASLRGDKISILDYGYLAEARVSFESDLLEEAQGELDWCAQDAAEQGDAFVRDVWPSWQDVPLGEIAKAIFPDDQDFVMAKCVLGVGEKSASWLELTRIEADMPPELALTFCQIEQDRLLEVKAVLKDAAVPVYVLADFWKMLAERFCDLPYEKLSGARRVEPELDEIEIDPSMLDS